MEILLLEEAVDKGLSKNYIFKEIAKLEKEFFPKYPYNVEDIKKACQQNKGNSLMLLDKDKIIGYLIPLLFKNKDYLQILTIAVNKNYQKKGYGTKLIKKCEEIAQQLKLKKRIIRANISYPILKTLKNLKYSPMQLKDINEFVKEGIFSSKDIIRNEISDTKILNLFPKANAITKDIGKKSPYSFMPMVKNII